MVKSTSCLQWPGKKYVGTCSQPWRARSNFSAVDPRSEESTVFAAALQASNPAVCLEPWLQGTSESHITSVGVVGVLSEALDLRECILAETGWRSPSSGPFHFSWHTPSMQIVSEKRLWGKESESSVNHILPKLLSWIMPSLTSVRITLNTTCQVAGSAHWSFHL